MDWKQELERLEKLVRSSPENNQKALGEFLSCAERARIDHSLEGAKALWWIASMVDQRMGAKEAELLYVFAVQKMEKVVGTEDVHLAGVLHSIAYYLCEKGRLTEAETYYRRILRLREQADAKTQLEMIHAMNDFADCLEKQGKVEEAKLVRRTF